MALKKFNRKYELVTDHDKKIKPRKSSPKAEQLLSSVWNHHHLLEGVSLSKQFAVRRVLKAHTSLFFQIGRCRKKTQMSETIQIFSQNDYDIGCFLHPDVANLRVWRRY